MTTETEHQGADRGLNEYELMSGFLACYHNARELLIQAEAFQSRAQNAWSIFFSLNSNEEFAKACYYVCAAVKLDAAEDEEFRDVPRIGHREKYEVLGKILWGTADHLLEWIRSMPKAPEVKENYHSISDVARLLARLRPETDLFPQLYEEITGSKFEQSPANLPLSDSPLRQETLYVDPQWDPRSEDWTFGLPQYKFEPGVSDSLKRVANYFLKLMNGFAIINVKKGLREAANSSYIHMLTHYYDSEPPFRNLIFKYNQVTGPMDWKSRPDESE